MGRTLRYLSLFSGIEAASVAWADLPMEPVAFCEIDDFPSAVLSYRYPDIPNLGDITKVDWKEFGERYGAVDVVVGGSPCQSFSIAAAENRIGLEGASGLMYEYIRAVRELDPKPKYVLWENVPGALSSGAGQDFECLIRELAECGYGLAVWRVLDAQYFGVPQRRERLFAFFCLGGVHPAPVLLEREGLRRDFESSRKKRQALASALGQGVGEDDRDAVCIQINQKDEVRLMGGDGNIVGAICSSHGALKGCNIIIEGADG